MSAIVCASRSAGVLEFGLKEFREKFPKRGFKLRHHLSGRPEFQLSNLVRLAQRLPATQVEYHPGQLPVGQDPKLYPVNGLSIVETVRRIEENGSWMVLKNVQADPEYASLLRSCLDEVYARVDSSIRRKRREEAFIFISSPGAVTPYHLDEEHNFLIHIRGSKEIFMWDPGDRSVLSEPQAEYMLQIWHDPDYHRNLPFQEEFQKRATVFHLRPGEGLHFPVGAPHWVKNGPEVSISLSVTFRSNLSERQAIVYFVNRNLRRIGLDPAPPWKSAWRDSLKYGAFQTGRLVAGLFTAPLLQRRQDKSS